MTLRPVCSAVSSATALFCLVAALLHGAHSSPFLFPDPDCSQPTQTPHGYDDLFRPQGPGYQETLHQLVTALQEIVALTVRAARQELEQLASLWLSFCDNSAYPEDGGNLPEVQLSDVIGQGHSDEHPGDEHNGYPSIMDTPTLDIRIGGGGATTNGHSTDSLSETSSEGNRKEITVTRNTMMVTPEETDGGSTTTSEEVVSDTASTYHVMNSVDMTTDPEDITTTNVNKHIET